MSALARDAGLSHLIAPVRPSQGDYVFPAGLATVHIDREDDVGEPMETAGRPAWRSAPAAAAPRPSRRMLRRAAAAGETEASIRTSSMPTTTTAVLGLRASPAAMAARSYRRL